ncbi:Small-conductance mechanosensitive channel [Alteripontixanthobacter maritimus]|uniref:Small-conductance mechanosensitive channel n=1 Tax=Alteripontixanthobacter maritimus TaxID=2161824 RepID=A0A369QBL6_9SPHN|nr:mechanosensitive ion channel family protein [Alteripontixanthobacter maritimus]RDC60965.1 Small-conductance mechanosensitive channel [Alteripontixanthobacter maritimus]
MTRDIGTAAHTWLAALLIALSALLFVAPASAAMLPSLDTEVAEPAPENEPAAQIDDTQDAGADRRIANRIEDIFAALPAFADTTVTVDGGVVTLAGTVPDDTDIERGAEIAGRVAGVVTVENQLERNVSVDDGLASLGGLRDMAESFLEMLPLIALAAGVAFAIGLIGYLIAGLTGLWRRIAPNSFLAELLASAIRFVFIVGGIVIALDMIGASALLGAVLGGAGVIGLALGFALRDTVENYVASLMLSLRQPFRANDHVLIDDMEGRIIRLTSRATVMMTLDGNHLRIPNSTVFKAVILNYTRNPQRRFEFDLGVDADDDPRAARKVGKAALDALPFILRDPPSEARIIEVGDSNIVIRFLAWIDQSQADFFKAKTRAIPAVKDALEGAGFGLPEPIYRLRFDERTMPLPFETIEKAKPKKGDPEPAREKAAHADVTVTEADEDVAPQDEVARMVDRERSAQSDENDLLDEGRPVE